MKKCYLLFLTLAFAIFAGCDADPGNDDTQANGKGSLQISLPKNSSSVARTAFGGRFSIDGGYDYTPASYTLRLVNSQINFDVEKTGLPGENVVFGDLYVGNYSLLVKGLNAAGNEILNGDPVQVAVIANQSSTVSVSLSWATGSAAISISIPDSPPNAGGNDPDPVRYILLQDDFNRTNSSNGDIGPLWNVDLAGPGTSTRSMLIDNNAVRFFSENNVSPTANSAQVYSADGSIKITAVVATGASVTRGKLQLHATTSTVSISGGFVDNKLTIMHITTDANGEPVFHSYQSSRITIAPNKVYGLGLIISPSRTTLALFDPQAPPTIPVDTVTADLPGIGDEFRVGFYGDYGDTLTGDDNRYANYATMRVDSFTAERVY